jgi:hypothetical protein
LKTSSRWDMVLTVKSNPLGQTFSQAPQPTHLNSSIDREALGTHVDGVKLTGLDAVAHAHAAHVADPFAAVKGGHGGAGHGAIVMNLFIGTVAAVCMS